MSEARLLSAALSADLLSVSCPCSCFNAEPGARVCPQRGDSGCRGPPQNGSAGARLALSGGHENRHSSTSSGQATLSARAKGVLPGAPACLGTELPREEGLEASPPALEEHWAVGFTGKEVDTSPGSSSWEKAMGSALWMASPEERQACAGASASGPKSSPASRRYLLPLALTVGPQGPERSGAERVPAAARPWGQSRTRCTVCTIWAFMHPSVPSGPGARGPGWVCREGNTCPLALPLLLGPLLLSLSLLSPSCVSQALSLRSHQIRGSSDGSGGAFPPNTEAWPPCLLRSASSLRDIGQWGHPLSLRVSRFLKTFIYLAAPGHRCGRWTWSLTGDRAGPLHWGHAVLASDRRPSLWDGPAGWLPSPWAAGSLQGPAVCLSGSAFCHDGFPGLSAPL